ncbi:MAG: HipA domain-containing protein [Deltaproteobacteria bacterium]
MSAIPVLEPHYVELGTREYSLPGDAPKSLVLFRGDVRQVHHHAFIAKAPRREGIIECTTEHLIARLASVLPVAVARSRLARIPRGSLGDPDVRFMSRLFTRTHDRLVHGVEIVGRCLGLDRTTLDRELTRATERDFYTVDTVHDILVEAYAGPSQPAITAAFGRMLAFDALIGANDRHAMNWGVIEDSLGRREPRFAPLFDTARGLLWNHDDAALRRRAAPARARTEWLHAYADRSRTLIAAPGSPRGSHFELAEYLRRERHPLLPEMIRVVRAFRPIAARRVLHEEMAGLLTPLRLELIAELLAHRHARLLEIVSR